MTVLWFALAVICAAGAAALIVVDRRRRDMARSERTEWAQARGYQYTDYDEDLPGRWSGAAMSKLRFLPGRDIVRGRRRGERFILLDVDDSATLVAVRRPQGSDVDVDLRPADGTPPRSDRLALLGRFGDRVIYTSDPDIARRVCDNRMAAFIDSVPSFVDLLWSEGPWTLGTIPYESDAQQWDTAIETVARLSGLLRVLPPSTGPGEPARPADAALALRPTGLMERGGDRPFGPGPFGRGPLSEPGPVERGPLERGPMERGPMERGPMERGPMERGPLQRGPIERGRIERGRVERAPFERPSVERPPVERGAEQGGWPAAPRSPEGADDRGWDRPTYRPAPGVDRRSDLPTRTGVTPSERPDTGERRPR
nr:hypothetical protein [Millisia brevis]